MQGYKVTLRAKNFFEEYFSKTQASFHILYLWQEYLRRHEKNPYYSISAYCRDLGLDNSHFGRILSGERKIKFSSAMRVLEKLNLEEELRYQFLTSVRCDQRRRIRRKKQNAG